MSAVLPPRFFLRFAVVFVAVGLAWVSAWPRGTLMASPALAAPDVPGRIFFVHEGDIWVLENGRPRPITFDGGWRQPSPSPDGSRIAVVGAYASATDLFLINSDGSVETQLTRNRPRGLANNEWAFYPRWSPSGQSIAYISDRASFYPMLWIMRADGTAPRQITFVRNGADAIGSFAWSPDGGQIAATRFSVSDSQISLIDLGPPATSRPLTAEPGGAFDPAWSPDGRFLAYVARVGNRAVVSALEPQTGSPAMLLVETDLARAPQWSPSGSSLAYLALAGGNFEIFMVDVRQDANGVMQAGRPVQLTNDLGADSASGLSWGA